MESFNCEDSFRMVFVHLIFYKKEKEGIALIQSLQNVKLGFCKFLSFPFPFHLSSQFIY